MYLFPGYSSNRLKGEIMSSVFHMESWGNYYGSLPYVHWHSHQCAWCPNTIDCAENDEDTNPTVLCLDCEIEVAYAEYFVK